MKRYAHTSIYKNQRPDNFERRNFISLCCNTNLIRLKNLARDPYTRMCVGSALHATFHIITKC